MAEQGTPDDHLVVGTGSTGSEISRRLLASGCTVHASDAGAADTEPNIHSPRCTAAFRRRPSRLNGSPGGSCLPGGSGSVAPAELPARPAANRQADNLHV